MAKRKRRTCKTRADLCKEIRQIKSMITRKRTSRRKSSRRKRRSPSVTASGYRRTSARVAQKRYMRELGQAYTAIGGPKSKGISWPAYVKSMTSGVSYANVATRGGMQYSLI